MVGNSEYPVDALSSCLHFILRMRIGGKVASYIVIAAVCVAVDL